MDKEESEIKDLYKGDLINVWKDDELTYLTIANTTISVPNEMWNDLRIELKEL